MPTMLGKETSITPETYSSRCYMYGYDFHPKLPKHMSKYFKLFPLVDFCGRIKARRRQTSLLDLGSGVGAESAALINSLRKTRVFSVDISTEGARKGKRKYDLDQSQADIARLPFGEKSFDAIHCKDVLVHISDKRAFLTEIARVLKCHGLLLLVSSKKAWTEYIQFEWTPEEVIAAAECQGLELISMDIKNLRTDDWYAVPKDRVFLMFRKK